MTTPIPSPLDQLFAPLEAAAATGIITADDRVSDLLHDVSDTEGCALVTDLTAAGYDDAVIAAALTPPPGGDKRKAASLAFGLVGGHRMVWLRSSGWAAVGQTNRRENKPSGSQLRHRLAPVNFQRRMQDRVVGSVLAYGVYVDITYGVELRNYVTPLKGDAWSIIKGSDPQAAKEAGRVQEGVYPDVLVYENWPAEQFKQRTVMWPHTGDEYYRDGVQPATWVVAVEIELSGKNDNALDRKMDRHDIAMKLGWWQAVVWITDDERVLTRLRRAGLGVSYGQTPDVRWRRPGHYLLEADDAGVASGTTITPPPMGVMQPWWTAQLQP